MKASVALLAGVGLIAVALWSQREPIAESLINQRLKEAGINGSYTIEALGTQHQRITNIRLGDPNRPDLIADWAEIEMGWSLSGPVVKAIRASGVRLNGRVQDGRVSLGKLDALLPAPSDAPFIIPSYDVDLRDARMALSVPGGVVGLAVTGKGNLANGFRGQVAAASQGLSAGGCRVEWVGGTGQVAVDRGAPRFAGTIKVQQLDCAETRLAAASMDTQIASTKDFKSFDLNGKYESGLIGSGPYSAQSATGTVKLSGPLDGAKGDYLVRALGVSSPQGRATGAELTGSFSGSLSGAAALAARGGGAMSLSGFVPSRDLTARISQLGGESGTPVSPFVAAIKDAVAGLSRGTDVSARYALDMTQGAGQLRVMDVKGFSRSGIEAVMTGAAPITLTLPGGAYRVDGGLKLQGGGLPGISAQIAGGAGGLAGRAVMTSWQRGGSRLSLTPISFKSDRAGLALRTVATIDGPLGNGRVAGLTVPLDIRPGQSPLSGCFSPGFRELAVDSLLLRNAVLRACLTGNEARLIAPRLTGVLGNTPLSLAASGATVSFAKGGFQASDLAVRLGRGEDITRLDAARVAGSLGHSGAKGVFSGLSAKLAPVPIDLSQGEGQWTLDGGNLSANGRLMVADSVSERRFNPLVSNDFALKVLNGRVTAMGTLRNPVRSVDVARVDIDHALSAGTGDATITMPGLTFGPAIQPEELTPITLGVIANVAGTLSGSGRIDWTPQAVTSSGRFGTTNMDLAAAFGPVRGLRGEIALSDLLGLQTGPGQNVKIASINPGIEVIDGEIAYQLLPDLRVRIEGGRWPFAGGWLVLEPTEMDLNQASERRLTFRVEDLDIARFIAAMEFENIAATGRFDGTLPMIFDARGGRIVGGRLVAQGGGTLSYVGEISNENLGAMGQFAFDALKSLKYDRLSIDLDGEIDGDVITRIRFAGVNQAPINATRAKLPIPIKIRGLTNIPFIFNVTITAKFRQLFEMARSFNDPSVLINRIMPEFEPVPGEKAKPVTTPVQPNERPPVP